MKKFKIVLGLLICFGFTYADDAGSIFAGADGGVSTSIGGTGGYGNSISSASANSGSQGGVVVPSLSPIGSDNSLRLSLNNQQLFQNSYANVGGQNPFQGNQGYNPYANQQFQVTGGSLSSAASAIDDFQNNVALRTGVDLKRFGYNQFNSPQVASNSPVDGNYIIGPNDQIVIQGWGMIDVNYTLTVDQDGSIFVPKIGKINVAGIKANSLDGYLKSKFGEYYKDFTVSATVTQVRTISVYVAGFAARPGMYQVSSLAGLSNIIFQIGGPSNVGSLRDIQVKRNGRVVAHYDMYDILINGDNSRDINLQPGDIIYFPPVGNNVAIYDGVKTPAIYEMKPNETIGNLVKFAGGFTFNGESAQVVLEHINPNKEIVVKDFTGHVVMSEILHNGDIVHFFIMNNIYESTITLMGNVAQPTRLAYRQGMTVQDVIPSRSALLTKSFWDSYSRNTYAKDNVLTKTGVEKTSNLVSKLSNDSSYSSGFTKGQQNTTNVFGAGDNLFTAGPLSIPEANINWNYAAIIRMDQRNFATHVIPFNLGKAIDGDPNSNIKLQPGDIINVLSTKDVRISSLNSVKYVFIDGEVVAPGVYEMPPGSRLLDVIHAAGGTFPSAYVYGTELDRVAVKKKQKLMLNQMLDQLQQSLLGQASNSSTIGVTGGGTDVGMVLQQQQQFIDKLRQINPNGRVVLGLKNGMATESDLPNIALENGDTVYIPPVPSTIDVIGQVYNQSSTMYKEGLTLSDYIKQAGGPNQFADTSNIYIVHADGTLLSKATAGWYGGFDMQKLNPGDTVVVPQTIQIGGAVQNILNWTQIIANFGTAAAAITVFK